MKGDKQHGRFVGPNTVTPPQRDGENTQDFVARILFAAINDLNTEEFLGRVEEILPNILDLAHRGDEREERRNGRDRS